MTDDELQQAFQAALQAPASDDPPVDFERVFSAVAGDTSSEEMLEVLDLTVKHLSWARAWQEALEMLKTRDASPPLTVVQKPNTPAEESTGAKTKIPRSPSAPTSSSVPWIPTLILLAATMLIGIGIGLRPSPTEPVYRGDEHTVELKSPSNASRSSCTLSWSGIPPRSHVNVSILNPALEIIDQASGVDLDSYTIPEQKLSTIPSGAYFLWRVQLTTPQGVIHKSQTARVTLKD